MTIISVTWDEVNKVLLSSENRKVKKISQTREKNPDMTSAVLPYGEVKASNQAGSPAWRAFGAVLNGANNGWRTTNSVSMATNQWISYTFPEPVIINKYSLRGGGGGVGNSIMPRNFRFEGSNDEVSWDVLDEREDVIFTNADTDWRDFESARFGSYKTYRIYSLTNNGDRTYTGISNLRFIGEINSITEIPDSTEKNFIQYGMSPSELEEVDMSENFTEKKYIQDEFTALGEGRVFTQPLDINKRIKKVSVK